MIGCGEDTRGMRGGLRVAEVGRSYPFQQVDRDPWAMPKLFEAPGYDSEWTYIDEEDNEEVVQSGSLEQIAEEPPASLCGNGVLEVGEDCDLGDENGHWDEGRSLDALCTLTCQNPVWRGISISKRSHIDDLSHSGSLMEMSTWMLIYLGGSCGAHFEKSEETSISIMTVRSSMSIFLS